MSDLTKKYTLGNFPVTIEELPSRGYFLEATVKQANEGEAKEVVSLADLTIEGLPSRGYFLEGIVKQADEDEGDSKKAVTAARLADLTIFFVGVRIFMHALEAGGIDTANMMAKSSGLGRRLFNQFSQGFDNLYEAPAETLRLKVKFQQAVRGRGAARGIQTRVDFLMLFLPRLSARLPLLRATFQGRAALAMMRLARLDLKADDLETLVGNLKELASIPPVSGFQPGRKWLRDAAKSLGAPVSENDEAVADASLARDLSARIREIDSELSSSRKGTKKAAALEEEKAALSASLQVAIADSDEPATTKAAAIVEQTERHGANATSVGQRTGLSPDQEAAMTVRGKAVIAAGAGSGKTRVLAAKVVHHLEQGLNPENIIACSFTRKSAAELKDRIVKYGGALTGNKTAEAGFGTTHFVAGVLVLGQVGRRPYDPKQKSIKDWVQNDLIRLAIEQVKMRPSSDPPPVDPEESFFPKTLPTREQDLQGPSPVGDPKSELEEALHQALSYHQRIPVQGSWLDWTIGFLEDMIKRNADPFRLSPKQKNALDKAFRRAKVHYTWPSKTASTVAGHSKKALNNQKQIEKLQKDYPVWSTRPANMWFNLGAGEEQFAGEDGGEALTIGQLALYISNKKGKLTAPGKAWSEVDHVDTLESDPFGPIKAAVYGAYEWLSKNEESFAGAMDMDDVLIEASKLLIEDPRALARIQSRIKCILVDEAQDLNAAQHLLFGLIAGYIDPATQEPRKDGQMTADTFAYIGDDKQAIYEFRGAVPDLFIEKSDLVEEGEGFTTKLLDMNYRSGSAIVEAANNLIKHNEKQIPMVCKANVERKGDGSIRQVTLEDQTACAVYAADQIQMATQGLEEDQDDTTQGARPSDFGVAVRTNKEAYQYGLEMIKRGIPFKSKYNFFKGPAVKSLLNLMTLSTEKSDVRRINRAVVEGVKAPDWGVSEKTLKKRLEERAGKTANWYDYLQKGGWKQLYGRGEYQDRLKAYTEYLKKVATLDADLGSEGVLNFLVNYPGPDGDLIDALVEKVKNSKDDMEEFGQQYEDRSEENLRAFASAPINVMEEIAKTYPKLEDSVSYLNELYEMNEKLSSTDDPNAKDFKKDLDAVQIDTVHGWKGLECKNLFVPMWAGRKGGFPHSMSEDITSERRLAYVALTRGEDSVTILRPMYDGAVDKSGNPIPTKTSPFVTEACIAEEPAYQSEDAVEETTHEARRKTAKFNFTDDELDAFINEDHDYLESLAEQGPSLDEWTMAPGITASELETGWRKRRSK